ncbi:MAG: hypothetical protein WB683_00620 [Candidatus Sulfotelmatobacter sp.]
MALTLAGVLMAIGLAISGFVSPTAGVACLFGGAAIWIVFQKKTTSFLERLIASKNRRQALDEESEKRQHTREQFLGLSAAEKEAVKYVKLNGHILPQQVASHLATHGFADADGIIDKVRSKTPFLLGSFSGEFSINPELKEPLDELLNPPLLNPTVRGVALAAVVIVVIGCGYLFRKHAYPSEEPKNETQSRSAPQSVTTQQRTPSEGEQGSTSAQIPTTQKQRKKPGATPTAEPAQQASLREALPKQDAKTTAAEKPSQDNSVHIDGGATVDQRSTGDCSPNIIGASNTVNCGAAATEIKWQQRDVIPPALPEDKHEFKFEKQITVMVNGTYTPVSLGFVCDAEIEEVDVGMEGAYMRLMPRTGTDRDNHKMGFAYFEGTPATPERPLFISVWSNQPFSVLEVKQARINVH